MAKRIVIPLFGTGTWLITHDGGQWWSVPYTVWSPRGLPKTSCYTEWGARRALRKLRAAGESSPYREGEMLVHEEAADG